MPQGVHLSETEELAVVKLLKQELSLATIKRRTGLSECTIREINKKYNARPKGQRNMYS